MVWEITYIPVSCSEHYLKSMVIDVQDFVKEKVNFTEMTGRYVFIRVTSRVRGPDWEKVLYALNPMTNQGWKFVHWIAYGAFGGYLLER